MAVPSHWDIGAVAEIAPFSGVKIRKLTEKNRSLMFCTETCHFVPVPLSIDFNFNNIAYQPPEVTINCVCVCVCHRLL
jgi:hypothetical protein